MNILLYLCVLYNTVSHFYVETAMQNYQSKSKDIFIILYSTDKGLTVYVVNRESLNRLSPETTTTIPINLKVLKSIISQFSLVFFNQCVLLHTVVLE